jgi:hypothetical protein
MTANALRRSGAFTPALIVGIILVGVFAFSAFVVLSAFAPELSSGHDGRAHALSPSAVGFAGAVQMARAIGAPVSVGRVVASQDRTRSLVIVTPEQSLSWEDLDRIVGRATLVILPKWGVGPDPDHRGWVVRTDAVPPQLIATIAANLAPGVEIARNPGDERPQLFSKGEGEFTAGHIQTLQTISGPGLIPIVVDSGNRIVLARLQRNGTSSNVFVLADPDFLNTQGIADIDNARAGFAMIGELRANAREPIVFDVTLNGLGGSQSVLRLAFEPPMLGATIGLAIVAGLLGWRAALRFGPSAPPRRAIALGKAALADNSAALIRLTGRERKLGPGYARMTGAAAAEEAGLTRRDEEANTAVLDQLSVRAGAPTLSQLTAEADAAQTSRQMLEAARKLHAWKSEITRATQ